MKIFVQNECEDFLTQAFLTHESLFFVSCNLWRCSHSKTRPWDGRSFNVH